MVVSTATRRLVKERANARCEYCRIPEEEFSAATWFVADHIRPKSEFHDDETLRDDPENLAWACPRCNGHKLKRTQATDPETGEDALCSILGMSDGKIIFCHKLAGTSQDERRKDAQLGRHCSLMRRTEFWDEICLLSARDGLERQSTKRRPNTTLGFLTYLNLMLLTGVVPKVGGDFWKFAVLGTKAGLREEPN